MKFKLNLTGKQFFPLFLAFLILFAFYFYCVFQLSFQANMYQPSAGSWGLFVAGIIIFIFGMLALYTPLLKLFINNLELDGKSLNYSGSMLPFIGRNLLGIFLSAITLGIYGAWYMRNIYGYITENINYEGNHLEFKGTGGRLFVIFLLALLLPVVIYAVVVTVITLQGPDSVGIISVVLQILLYFLLIPYYFYVIKWSINFAFGSLNIDLNAEPSGAMKVLLVQVFLTIITLGIYYPAAYAKLFSYFGNRVTAVNPEDPSQNTGVQVSLSYKRAFLLTWGQVLLCIITVGLYTPWATVRILRFYLDGVSIGNQAATENA